MFQIEILEVEEVYACNISNEGFDKDNEVIKPISNDHKDVLIQIEEGDNDNTSKESYGDSWLAKFDDDGNLLGWMNHHGTVQLPPALVCGVRRAQAVDSRWAIVILLFGCIYLNRYQESHFNIYSHKNTS